MIDFFSGFFRTIFAVIVILYMLVLLARWMH